jgi:hypothetical protein
MAAIATLLAHAPTADWVLTGFPVVVSWTQAKYRLKSVAFIARKTTGPAAAKEAAGMVHDATTQQLGGSGITAVQVAGVTVATFSSWPGKVLGPSATWVRPITHAGVEYMVTQLRPWALRMQVHGDLRSRLDAGVAAARAAGKDIGNGPDAEERYPSPAAPPALMPLPGPQPPLPPPPLVYRPPLHWVIVDAWAHALLQRSSMPALNLGSVLFPVDVDRVRAARDDAVALWAVWRREGNVTRTPLDAFLSSDNAANVAAFLTLGFVGHPASGFLLH